MSDPSWSLGCALTVNPNFTSSSPLVVTLEEEEGKGKNKRGVKKMKIKMLGMNEDQDGRGWKRGLMRMRVSLEMRVEVDSRRFMRRGTRIAYSHSSVGPVCTSEEATGCAVKHRHLGPATISMQAGSAKICIHGSKYPKYCKISMMQCICQNEKDPSTFIRIPRIKC